jgi:hypothetical protein
MGLKDRLQHAWNAFTDSDSVKERPFDVYGGGGSYFGGRPDRIRPRFSNERSIISSIYTRIGIDVAAVPMRHVRMDDQNRYLEDIDSGLDTCLTLEANVDQAGRAFRQDIAMTILDQGVAAIVPVDTTLSPEDRAGSISSPCGSEKSWRGFPNTFEFCSTTRLVENAKSLRYRKRWWRSSRILCIR